MHKMVNDIGCRRSYVIRWHVRDALEVLKQPGNRRITWASMASLDHVVSRLSKRTCKPRLNTCDAGTLQCLEAIFGTIQSSRMNGFIGGVTSAVKNCSSSSLPGRIAYWRHSLSSALITDARVARTRTHRGVLWEYFDRG